MTLHCLSALKTRRIGSGFTSKQWHTKRSTYCPIGTTSVFKHPHPLNSIGARWIALCIAVGCGISLLGLQRANAQGAPPTHLRYEGYWPPGMIGQTHLRGDMRRVGYFQPVELMLPEGAKLSLAEAGQFTAPQPGPMKVGLQLGQVYRFKVSHVPLREGAEIFPTLEVIDRLHPPEGGKWRFPVPVQITREEFDIALSGRYVTRVIYVENPTTALAHHVDRRFQRYFEVRPEADPLQVADQLGRPIAILRIGSRVQDQQGPSDAFLYGSPAMERDPGVVDEQPFEIVPTPAAPRVRLPRRN